MRLFLAIWPAADVLAALAALQSAWRWPPGVALVPTERLHLTLHFLGAVPARAAGRLRCALSVPFEPFALGPGQCRMWPGGIAVLEFAQLPAAAHALHAALGRALRAEGLRVEDRAWRPHVTFARKAASARPPAAAVRLDWLADAGYALVRSAPGSGYETLRAFGGAGR
jgi:2'-5' RNA ligase